MNHRRELHPCRNHMIQKVRVDRRTLSISVHEGPSSWLSTAGVKSSPM